jgi:hypothetical protein
LSGYSAFIDKVREFERDDSLDDALFVRYEKGFETGRSEAGERMFSLLESGYS